jgi:hypothetical protein
MLIELSDGLQVAGRAVGAVNGQLIAGTIGGMLVDTRSLPHRTCFDTHAFETVRTQ